jgi:DNA topoisomerase-6 subunit B
VASVWVPFTSESKQAIAEYPEIVAEIELALRHCGRELGAYVHRASGLEEEFGKRREIEKYLPHIGAALKELLELDDAESSKLIATLDKTLNQRRVHRS